MLFKVKIFQFSKRKISSTVAGCSVGLESSPTEQPAPAQVNVMENRRHIGIGRIYVVRRHQLYNIFTETCIGI